MAQKNKKTIFWVYGALGLGILVYFAIKHFFALSPFLLTYSFFLFLILPGFSLSRIFRLTFSKDLYSKFMLYLVLGLMFALVISLFAIVAPLTLSAAVVIYFLAMSLVLMTALILDIFRPTPLDLPTFDDIKTSLFKNWPFYLIFLFLIFLILCSLDVRGADFRGDPFFHLAVLRKAMGDFPLSAVNLSYVRTQLHIAYSFPVWHVYMAILHRTLGYNIFTLWNELIIPLSLMAVLTWYWLFRSIVKKTGMAVLLLGFYLLLTVIMRQFYIYTRLPVPDTLGQHILLPMALTLLIKYVYDLKTNYKLLITIAIFGAFMGVVHFTQYFYFLSVVFVFLVTFTVLGISRKEYLVTVKRIFYVGALSAGIMLPFLAVLQITGKSLLKTVQTFMGNPAQVLKYGTFDNISVYAKYAYVLLPLLLIFIKRNKTIVFLIAIMLTMPVFYAEWLGIKGITMKFLSFIFINRLYANVVWYFAVIGLFFGIIFIFFDKLLDALSRKWKYVSLMVGLVLMVIFGLAIQAQIKNNFLTHLFEGVFSKGANAFLNTYHIALIAITLIIAIVICVFEYLNQKTDDFFKIKSFSHPVVMAICTAMILFFISAQDIKIYKFFPKEFRGRYFFRETENSGGKVISYGAVGGPDTVRYIEKNIPPKSIFLSDSGYFMLPILVDQHMANYSSSADTIAAYMYDGSQPLDYRLKHIRDTQTDYILMILPNPKKIEAFDSYPQYFTKIYENRALIYKVNRENIKADYP